MLFVGNSEQVSHFSGIFTFEFEHVNAGWVTTTFAFDMRQRYQ